MLREPFQADKASQLSLNAKKRPTLQCFLVFWNNERSTTRSRTIVFLHELEPAADGRQGEFPEAKAHAGSTLRQTCFRFLSLMIVSHSYKLPQIHTSPMTREENMVVKTATTPNLDLAFVLSLIGGY